MSVAIPKIEEPKDPAEAAARQVRAWRAWWGWTLKELADRSGVCTSTIQKIERGDGSYTLKTLVAVSNALGCVVRVESRPEELSPPPPEGANE